MGKKKTNVQNIIIIILCILLATSIGFGVTYSYYNGKSDLVKGTITTANLSIDLLTENIFGQTSNLLIENPADESFLVPGNSLNNAKVNLINKCNQKTYMVVLYTLSARKNDTTQEDVTSQLNNTPAIAFQSEAYNTDVWRSISYRCENINATYTCLVGIDPFEPRERNSEGYPITVLNANSIKIPEQWNDVLQNCIVTISITAYAIQAENLSTDYTFPILEAEENNDMSAKAQAIAKAVLEICEVDHVKQ
ncbi:MAG: hypothetical protein ACLRFE_01530 [Clostridia bacterium]